MIISLCFVERVLCSGREIKYTLKKKELIQVTDEIQVRPLLISYVQDTVLQYFVSFKWNDISLH